MIKKCRVILHNEDVTVFAFGDTNVQIPSIKNDGTLYVELKDGKYTVVTKCEFEKLNKHTGNAVTKKDKKENIVIDNEEDK